MRGLLYVSDAEVEFGLEELRALARHASERNAETGITGYLYFEKSRFLQYVEGEREAVDELMPRIEADDRHRVLGTVVDDDLVDRRFPSWSMGRIVPSAVPGVERTLADHVRLMTHVANRSPNWERGVWALVEEIARLVAIRPELFA